MTHNAVTLIAAAAGSKATVWRFINLQLKSEEEHDSMLAVMFWQMVIFTVLFQNKLSVWSNNSKWYSVQKCWSVPLSCPYVYLSYDLCKNPCMKLIHQPLPIELRSRLHFHKKKAVNLYLVCLGPLTCPGTYTPLHHHDLKLQVELVLLGCNWYYFTP